MGEKLTGAAKALNLDERARALAVQNAAADPEGDQLGLFEGSSVFGTIVVGTDRIVPNGRGRPKGSQNKSTAELVKYLQSKGRHPLVGLAEIVATPIDVLARTLGCEKLEAAEFWRKCAGELAPYMAQKQPMALQVEGANAGTLNLVVGVNVGGDGGGQFGLTATLATAQAAIIEHEQNQALSEGEAAASNSAPSNE